MNLIWPDGWRLLLHILLFISSIWYYYNIDLAGGKKTEVHYPAQYMKGTEFAELLGKLARFAKESKK